MKFKNHGKLKEILLSTEEAAIDKCIVIWENIFLSYYM